MNAVGSEDGSGMDKIQFNPEACEADAANIHPLPGIAKAERIPGVTSPQAKQHNRGKDRFFGIPRRNVTVAAYLNPDDYESKYPEDLLGEEMAPTARVWRVYLDEAQKADAELMEGWRDTTDVLLVFAGLFSAVVATFVVQTSSALQPNYSQVTASLLLETNSLLRAMISHTSANDTIPPFGSDPAPNFSSSSNDRWVNGLWFTSLAVSLVVAFTAVLVKQWMQHYQSVIFGTLKEQVQIRQFRCLGVDHWQMPLIINTLPMLLHLALLLYFAGLVLFLVPLDASIAYTAATIAGLAYIFYFLSTILPLVDPMCPYKTPLSSLLAAAIASLQMLASLLMRHSSTFLHSSPLGRLPHPGKQSQVLNHMRNTEKESAQKITDEIDAHALVWLYSTSSNPTVTSIAVEAISGLRLDVPPSCKNIIKETITFGLNTVEFSRFLQSYSRHQHIQVEKLVRASHQLGTEVSQYYNRFLNDSSMITSAVKQAMGVESEGSEGLVAALEAYDYSPSEDSPLLWTVLLTQSLLYSFRSPLECWLHGFQVLNNFSSSSINNQHLRLSMALEYFCSLSILDTDGRRQAADPNGRWGDERVLDGATFCFAKVAPNICSALSTAIGTVRNEKDHQCQVDLGKTLWNVLLLDHVDVASVEELDAVGKQNVISATIGLREEIQKLVESHNFWKAKPSSPRSRDLCCEIVFGGVTWLRWVSDPPPISWTPDLMDWFLQSNVNSTWFSSSRSHLYSYFSKGNPTVYQLFEERNGLCMVKREGQGSNFMVNYLDGLQASRWMGTSIERERQLAYLFDPDNLARIIPEFFVRHKDGIASNPVEGCTFRSSGMVTRLFKLRSPDQHRETYGHHLDALRELQSQSKESWESCEPTPLDFPAPSSSKKVSTSIPGKLLGSGSHALRQLHL